MNQGDEEESRLEFDTINLVFGAALSAYVGVILSRGDLSNAQLSKLVIILSSLVTFILGIKAVYRSLLDQPYVGLKWPWNLVLVLISGAVIQILAFSLPLGGNEFSFLFRGWLLVYALVLGVSVVRRRWK